MKRSNKLLAGIVTLASAMTLAACQSTNDNTSVITMKGDTISVSDFYNETKNTEISQRAMLNLVVSRVFEDQYGKKVSKKKQKKPTINQLSNTVRHSLQPLRSLA